MTSGRKKGKGAQENPAKEEPKEKEYNARNTARLPLSAPIPPITIPPTTTIMVVMHAHIDLGRLEVVVDVVLRTGSAVVALSTRGLRPVVVVAAELVVRVRVLVGVGEVALRGGREGQGVPEGRGRQGGLLVVVVVVGVGGVPGFEFGDGAVGGC